MDTLFYGKVTGVRLVKQETTEEALPADGAGWGRGEARAGALGPQGAHRA